MTSEEIKNMLHEEIEKIDEVDLLLAVKEIIDNKYNTTYPEITEGQQKRIKESEDQIENGEFVTNEEADKIVNEWLSK